MKEFDCIKKEKDDEDDELNLLNDLHLFDTDIYSSIQQKHGKLIHSNSMYIDKEKNLNYISKPYLDNNYFKNWKDKEKHLIFTKDLGMVEGEINPLFLYEYISLDKYDVDKTLFTLIEVFPSICSEKRDKLIILRKHQIRKKFINFNSKINNYNDVDTSDPLGNLLINTVKK
jgi:hypothetical protein